VTLLELNGIVAVNSSSVDACGVSQNPPLRSRRRFDYDRRLLPNSYMAELEPEGIDLEGAIERSGLTIGYPAWNLLYFALLCSVPPGRADLVVLETGTNEGVSTIAMAQALADSGSQARLLTVDVSEELSAIARRNVERAGLSQHVEFHVGDAIKFLEDVTGRFGRVDFAFIDDDHRFAHVTSELEVLCPHVPPGGKVYFDNTTGMGIPRALAFLVERFGGSLVEFENCSWQPPGNAIWQAP
jgi:precorrin-6B methylase 2